MNLTKRDSCTALLVNLQICETQAQMRPQPLALAVEASPTPLTPASSYHFRNSRSPFSGIILSCRHSAPNVLFLPDDERTQMQRHRGGRDGFDRGRRRRLMDRLLSNFVFVVRFRCVAAQR